MNGDRSEHSGPQLRWKLGLHKGRTRLARVADWFPLTPLGVLVSTGAGLALTAVAHTQFDLVLLVVGYAGLGLSGLCALLVGLGALMIWLDARERRVELQPGTELQLGETQSPIRTGHSLPRLPWLPLVHSHWHWLEPDQITVEPVTEGSRVWENVRVQTRGQYRTALRRVLIHDVFGLACLGLRDRTPSAMDILPHLGALSRVRLLRSASGGDELPHPVGMDAGDRIELHRYVPGDPARFIHWKVYGRTRKLMVRKPERALSQTRRVAVFLVAAPGDEVAAALGRIGLEQGLRGADWVFGSDEDPTPTNQLDAALGTMLRSAALPERGTVQDRGGSGLQTFLEQAERKGPVSAMVLIPNRPGPWLERVAAVARGQRRRLRFVTGVDGLQVELSRSRAARLWVLPELHPHTPASGVREVVRRLGPTRSPVDVFDRISGRQLGELHWHAQTTTRPTPEARAG